MKDTEYLKLKKRKEILSTIRLSNRIGSHINCIRIFPNNSYKHEKTKFDICFVLRKYGYEFFTEAIFENGSRADILAIKDGEGTIIEIEQNKSAIEKVFEKKEANYPKNLKKIWIDLEKFNLEEFERELI